MNVGDRIRFKAVEGEPSERFIVTRVSPFVPMVMLNNEGWSWMDNLEVAEEAAVPTPEVQEQLDFLTL